MPRGTSLGVVPYGFWGPVLQSPAQGHPTIVGVLLPPLPRGQIPPSPRGRNFRPSLLMILISPLLCARLRSDGARSAAASTPSPPPSSTLAPAIPHSTGRSGGGRRRQLVVDPVEAMGGALYVPKKPGVEEVDLIEVPDIAGDGQVMVPHGPGLWWSLLRRRISRLLQ